MSFIFFVTICYENANECLEGPTRLLCFIVLIYFRFYSTNVAFILSRNVLESPPYFARYKQLASIFF